MGTGTIVDVDSRGAVYLGAERYLAGEQSPSGTVTSHVPGHDGEWSPLPRGSRDFGELVSRWELFKAEAPSYDSVLHPETARETALGSAQDSGPEIEGGRDVRAHIRDKLGKNEAQSARSKRAVASRRAAAVPW